MLLRARQCWLTRVVFWLVTELFPWGSPARPWKLDARVFPKALSDGYSQIQLSTAKKFRAVRFVSELILARSPA